MPVRIASVTIDCADPNRLAEFWAQALGYVRGDSDSQDEAGIEDPNDRDVELLFIRVPEGKAVKNRVHLDLGANDRDAEVERLAGLGAEIGERFERWTVMRDPEGNEFCVVQTRPESPIESWRP